MVSTIWPFEKKVKSNQESSPPKKNIVTLPETNIAPEIRPSQKEISIPTIHFQVLC